MVFSKALVLNEAFSFEQKDICVENGIFTSRAVGERIDCNGLMMLPGLVDIHTHGAVGFDAMDEGFDAINGISLHMARVGTTSFLPTIMTESNKVMTNAGANIAAAKDKVQGAKIAGIYMEGPYFSMKYKGAQNPEYVRKPDIAELEAINKASSGLIKIVSLAPESEGAWEFIAAVPAGVRLAAGHTDADYETMKKAMELGVTQLTHSFNAMRALHHREPAAIGAAIEGDAFCECICDGMHVHPAMVKLLYRAVGCDRLVLISDSIRPAGLPDGEYSSGGQPVLVKNGRATLKDGTIAGSSSSLFDCVKCAVSFGIPLEQAVKCASLNPARAAGIDGEAGSISLGKKADFLLVDNELNLKAVYVDGRQIEL